MIGWNMGYRWVMTECEFRKWFINIRSSCLCVTKNRGQLIVQLLKLN